MVERQSSLRRRVGTGDALLEVHPGSGEVAPEE